jgi:protein kinase C substrate 80K-H
MLVENGILADNANSGSESKAVSDARTAYQSVSDDLNAKRVSLGESQTDLTTDYGPQDIFRALKGVCISKDSGEYEYELCWMENTKQKSRKGGGSTGMGNFVRFDKGMFDEEVGADGKGVGSGERVTMHYENGQQCWNGPNRQTIVVLACAEKDEIWKVMEQEKCMYRMDVGTAAVCEKAANGGEGEKGTDEL